MKLIQTAKLIENWIVKCDCGYAIECDQFIAKETAEGHAGGFTIRCNWCGRTTCITAKNYSGSGYEGIVKK